MNWLDIILICLAVGGFLKGLFDGFIKQVVSLIAFVIAIILCSKVAVWLKAYIIALGWFPAEGVTIASYVLAFLLIVGLVLLVGQVMHRMIGITPLSLLNHITGGLFGLMLAILFSSLFLNMLELLDPKSVIISIQTKLDSHFYYQVKEIVPTIIPWNLF